MVMIRVEPIVAYRFRFVIRHTTTTATTTTRKENAVTNKISVADLRAAKQSSNDSDFLWCDANKEPNVTNNILLLHTATMHVRAINTTHSIDLNKNFRLLIKASNLARVSLLPCRNGTHVELSGTHSETMISDHCRPTSHYQHKK